MPVVAETYDGVLNDINAMQVDADHAIAALDAATSGPVAEGSTGGGNGMICYEFKGGTGTSSRRVKIGAETYTIGTLVQANHGIRPWLTVQGQDDVILHKHELNAEYIDPLYFTAVQAVEEMVINATVAGEDVAPVKPKNMTCKAHWYSKAGADFCGLGVGIELHSGLMTDQVIGAVMCLHPNDGCITFRWTWCARR